MRKIGTIMIALAMAFAFAAPAMGQDPVCDPCTKCPPSVIDCPYGDQTGATCYGEDDYDVGTDPLVAYPACPVIFDICDCDDPSAFVSGTTVGVRLRLLVNGLEGDNGAYFSEGLTGNVIMGDSKTWLCDPACAVLPLAAGPGVPPMVFCDANGSGTWQAGEAIAKSDNFLHPSGFTYYQHNGTNYVLAAGGPSTGCPQGTTNKVVQIANAPGEGLVIDLEDETYDLSHWAIDIPAVIVTPTINDCSTISLQICLMTEGGGGICGECACVCDCVYDLYTTCCEGATGCIYFPYVVTTGTGWDTGIALMNRSTGLLPSAADMTATFTFVQADGTVSTWEDTNFESNGGLKTYAFSTGIVPNLVPAPGITTGSLTVDANFSVDGMLYLTNGVFGAAHLGRCCTGPCLTP